MDDDEPNDLGPVAYVADQPKDGLRPSDALDPSMLEIIPGLRIPLRRRPREAGGLHAGPNLNLFKPDPATPPIADLAFWPVDVALMRLVDFDGASRGNKPTFFPELNGFDQVGASHLYVSANLAFIADLIASADSDRISKARSVIGFAKNRGKIEGLESVFSTAMSALQSRGHPLLTTGYGLLEELGPLNQLGGSSDFSMFFDSQTSRLSIFGLGGMNRFLFGDEQGGGIRAGKDISTVAATSSGATGGAPQECNPILEAIARLVGAAAVASSDSPYFGNDKTKIDAANKMGDTFANMVCGGAHSSAPDKPNPSPPPKNDDDGGDDGADDPKPEHIDKDNGDNGDNPGHIDKDDDGFRRPDDDGGTGGPDPTDTPQHGSRHGKATVIPVEQDRDIFQGDFSGLPRRLRLNGAYAVDWGKFGAFDPVPDRDLMPGKAALGFPKDEAFRLMGEGFARHLARP